MATHLNNQGSNAAHSALVDAILIKIGALPYVRVWKRVVGVFYRVRFDKAGRVVSVHGVTVNTPGEPDIDGIIRTQGGLGLKLGIECKTGDAMQNPEQKKYQKMIEAMGGIYLLVRSEDQALTQIERVHKCGGVAQKTD